MRQARARPRPRPLAQPTVPRVETGVSMSGGERTGGLVKLASGSSFTSSFFSSSFLSPFHDSSPPNGDKAAKLAARLASSNGWRAAGTKGLSTSRSSSHGVEVANGTGEALSSSGHCGGVAGVVGGARGVGESSESAGNVATI